MSTSPTPAPCVSSKRSARGPQDPRSRTVQEVLRAKWRDTIKRLPPVERERWLRSSEGIVALGARQCHELLKKIGHEHDQAIAGVVSAPWLDAWDHQQQRDPGADAAHMQRPHSSKAILSRNEFRFGMTGRSACRYTPPHAVMDEDAVDDLSAIDAAYYDWPPSISALVIGRIAAVGGKEVLNFPAESVSKLMRRQ